MEAVGSYIRTLREKRGLTRVQLAGLGGTNEAQIIRIENGQIDTRGSLLFTLIHVLRGKAEDVQRLLLNPLATEIEAQRLAQERVDEELISRYQAEAEAMSDEELLTAIHELEREVQSDRGILHAWRGFLAGWRARRNA